MFTTRFRLSVPGQVHAANCTPGFSARLETPGLQRAASFLAYGPPFTGQGRAGLNNTYFCAATVETAILLKQAEPETVHAKCLRFRANAALPTCKKTKHPWRDTTIGILPSGLNQSLRNEERQTLVEHLWFSRT